MFGVIFHPQPVGRRRAVPELVVRGVEAELIGLGHLLLVPASVGGLGQMREARPGAHALDLVVEYRLGEYLRTLADYLPVEHLRRAELKGNASNFSSREEYRAAPRSPASTASALWPSSTR